MKVQQLQLFEGRHVRKHNVAMTGKVERAIGIEKMRIGDTVSMLVTGTVRRVLHEEDEDTGWLARTPTVQVGEIHVLDDGEGDEMLMDLRQRDREILEAILSGGDEPPFDAEENGEVPPT